jgi:hypothetical protein
MSGNFHVYPEYSGADGADHGFSEHRPGCPAESPSGCGCWEDLVTQQHLTDGRVCWCHPSIVEVLGTESKVVVHRRLEC